MLLPFTLHLSPADYQKLKGETCLSEDISLSFLKLQVSEILAVGFQNSGDSRILKSCRFLKF